MADELFQVRCITWAKKCIAHLLCLYGMPQRKTKHAEARSTDIAITNPRAHQQAEHFQQCLPKDQACRHSIPFQFLSAQMPRAYQHCPPLPPP